MIDCHGCVRLNLRVTDEGTSKGYGYGRTFLVNTMQFIDVNDEQSVKRFGELVSYWEESPYQPSIDYIEKLVAHIRHVQEAGRLIGVPEPQLLVHDQSKFSRKEFVAAANHHYGEGDPDGYAYAWLHHIHANEHHWQHWVYPEGFSPRGSLAENGAVPMPFRFVQEMVADFMGSERAYQGTWDISDWLVKKAPRMRLHSVSIEFFKEVLIANGFGDIVPSLVFKGEMADSPLAVLEIDDPFMGNIPYSGKDFASISVAYKIGDSVVPLPVKGVARL